MKRMIENKNGTWYVNASSVDVIQTCPRKAQYALLNGYRSEEESEALTFGKAIHAGLEYFYSVNPGERSLKAMVSAFEEAGHALSSVDAGDKRSLSNGAKILSRYYETYENDPWVTYVDEDGPFVERTFEVSLDEHITTFGTIDCILKNTETGEVVVCDHKTTTTVSDLIKRAKPNLQFSLYIFAAQKLGIPVTRAMVNGIQVAKTKSDLLRIFTDRNADDFEEMEQSLRHAVRLYSTAKSSNSWPMNTASCSHYGGCQYLEICQMAPAFRENALTQVYGRRE